MYNTELKRGEVATIRHENSDGSIVDVYCYCIDARDEDYMCGPGSQCWTMKYVLYGRNMLFIGKQYCKEEHYEDGTVVKTFNKIVLDEILVEECEIPCGDIAIKHYIAVLRGEELPF